MGIQTGKGESDMSANTQMERCPAQLNGNPPPRCRRELGHSGDHIANVQYGELSWHSTPAAPESPRSLPILDNQNAVKDRAVELTAWDKTGTPRKEEA